MSINDEQLPFKLSPMKWYCKLMSINDEQLPFKLSPMKWYCKLMSINGEQLPFKLSPNEWDKVKSKGHPRISWLAQVEFSFKPIGSPRPGVGIKLITKPLIKESVRSFNGLRTQIHIASL